MRIGIMSGHGRQDEGVEALIAKARDLEARGFPSLWFGNVFAIDAMTAIALIGRETESIELGTAVVPTFPRHPTVMAQQALTAQSTCRGRFTLGIGLSHQIVIEGLYGLSYARRTSHMREYLEVLLPLLAGRQADFDGEEYRVHVATPVPEAQPVSVVLAALGPKMLALAGARSDGTSLWMTGPKTVEEYVRPTIEAAAKEAGRASPRIISGLPVVLTNDEAAGRERISELMDAYNTIPSYRGVLDREGAASPGDVALVGDEGRLDEQLARLRDAGVTDLNAAIIPIDDGATERTLDFLASRS
ncbi:MAG: TIGR03564 family F420-dependent LLM class oxidoreductase [Myxococcota bacterium]